MNDFLKSVHQWMGLKYLTEFIFDFTFAIYVAPW